MAEKSKTKILGNKRLANIVIILFVFSVSLLIIAFIINGQKKDDMPIKTTEINVSFMIGESLGIITDTDMLHMGKISPGSSVNREFNVYPEEEPVQVYVEASPEIADYIFFEPNNFIMEPDVDNVTIAVTLTNTNNLSYGNYSGKATIYYFSVDE